MSTEQSIKKIHELVDSIKVAMMTTQSDHHLVSRPLQLIDFDDQHNLWFFTSIASEKVTEVLQRPAVNLSFANPNSNHYVSIAGEGKIVTDQNKIDDLWSYIMKAWYPDGKEDKDLVIVKVEPSTIEYWESSGNVIAQTYHLTKALLTGQKYDEVAPSDNQKVHIL